jgi:hypothetical protein
VLRLHQQEIGQQQLVLMLILFNEVFDNGKSV